MSGNELAADDLIIPAQMNELRPGSWIAVAPSTTHQALERLIDIGAVRANSCRGYTTVSSEKLLEAFAAHRNLRAATMVSATLRAAQEVLNDLDVGCALSATSAAVHYLGGRNTVADLGRRIVYSSPPLTQADFPAGDEVIILTADPVAARDGKSRFASLAQTYADLWASPGWHAAERTRRQAGTRPRAVHPHRRLGDVRRGNQEDLGCRATVPRLTNANSTTTAVGDSRGASDAVWLERRKHPKR